MGKDSPRARRPSASVPRRRNKRILVVTGGAETVVQYLNHVSDKIRGTGVSIHIAKSGNDPINLIAEAVARIREDRRKARVVGDVANVFDAVWIVCDIHEFRADILTARADAKRGGVRIANSNPCFELWLIWHQNDHDSPQSAKGVKRLAAKLGVIVGVGAEGICVENIAGSYHEAKGRAISAERMHSRNDVLCPDDNPSSNMYELVDYMLSSTVGMPGAKCIAL